ncbi:hypothetical protein PIB30_081468 [Stylosanthes scabra]|uniref:Uncharacterized protein n=1 Tax=Stylosanthes scabra TaxID=79078 RepID=A0ABU6TRA1_9FABA|nr:hypothetical protein [Stylosanthes scabra]
MRQTQFGAKCTTGEFFQGHIILQPKTKHPLSSLDLSLFHFFSCYRYSTIATPIFSQPFASHNISIPRENDPSLILGIPNRLRERPQDVRPLVGGITLISVGEVIKDSKGNGRTTILKDNHYSLHLNLLRSNLVILRKS